MGCIRKAIEIVNSRVYFIIDLFNFGLGNKSVVIYLEGQNRGFCSILKYSNSLIVINIQTLFVIVQDVRMDNSVNSVLSISEASWFAGKAILKFISDL